MQLTSSLKHILKVVKSSIAFYPSLIAFILAALAVVLLAIETPQLTQSADENLSILIIDNSNTARSLLGVLVGGIISLTVFSFSMVMIMLSQASNNYSPRILPGLISDKRHQFVLGFYIGTIIFSIICLINIIPGDSPYQIPAITILVAVALGLTCLALFVFFIHSISQTIQINNVLLRIYRETTVSIDRLRQKIEENAPSVRPEQKIDHWYPIISRTSGKLMTVLEEELIELAKDQDMELRLLLPRGMTVLSDKPVLAASKPLPQDIQNRVLDNLHYGQQERVDDNFLYGIKQLAEIAVRAMSPGTNDPGTAINALDFLTPVMKQRLSLPDALSLMDDEGRPRLHLKIVPFDELIYYVFSAIRTYAAHDPIIVISVLKAINYLLQHEAASDSYLHALKEEQKAWETDAKKHITNPHDRERIRLAMSEENIDD